MNVATPQGDDLRYLGSTEAVDKCACRAKLERVTPAGGDVQVPPVD